MTGRSVPRHEASLRIVRGLTRGCGSVRGAGLKPGVSSLSGAAVDHTKTQWSRVVPPVPRATTTEATHENLRSGVLTDYPGDLDTAPRRMGERFDVRRRKTTESQAGPKIILKSPIPTARQIRLLCRGAGRERAKRSARGNYYFFAHRIDAARPLT